MSRRCFLDLSLVVYYLTESILSSASYVWRRGKPSTWLPRQKLAFGEDVKKSGFLFRIRFFQDFDFLFQDLDFFRIRIFSRKIKKTKKKRKGKEKEKNHFVLLPNRFRQPNFSHSRRARIELRFYMLAAFEVSTSAQGLKLSESF